MKFFDKVSDILTDHWICIYGSMATVMLLWKLENFLNDNQY